MFLVDLSGEEYIFEAAVRTNESLEGDRSLSFVLYPTDVNRQFIHEIGELWELEDEEGMRWVIIYTKPTGKGNSLSVEVKAVPKIFDYLNTSRIYEDINEHMTASTAFEYIFSDTPYSFQLIDSFYAVQWEGFGNGKSRLEQFKDALNRYGAEFTLVGNEVRLHRAIGRDTQFMYHYKLNASNISKEIDAEELWTFARGFGDYQEEDAEPKLIREYRSPLADILGERHAPPIKDGRITLEETMDERLKQVVDNSLKVSVTATLHDLRKQGYPFAQPVLGDRVFLVDDRINLKDEMRVVNIVKTTDYKGDLIRFDITLGSRSLSSRRQSDIKHSIGELRDIAEGRKQLPLSALDNAVVRATRKLLGAETEVKLTDNGLVMVSKDAPNLMVVANSEGIGVSTDGGGSFRNAITGEGINTDLLMAGSIDAQRVRITAGDLPVLWVDGETGDVEMNVSRININGYDPDADGVHKEDLQGYLRYENGNVVLGEIGNEITLQLQNDRIQFLQDNREVAFFSNNKLYVTDIEVLQELRIGAFAYIPRSNGSLDFKKVVN